MGDNNSGCGCFVFSIIVVLAVVLAGGGDSSSSSPSGDKYKQQWNQESIKYDERENSLLQINIESQQNTSYPSSTVFTEDDIYDYDSGSRDNYQELWDECEGMSDVLDENNVDHEDMSYPMDYEGLEELRDDYRTLLDDNGLDY